MEDVQALQNGKKTNTKQHMSKNYQEDNDKVWEDSPTNFPMKKLQGSTETK